MIQGPGAVSMEEWIDDLRSVVVARSLTPDVSLLVYSEVIVAIYLRNNNEHMHTENRGPTRRTTIVL